MDVFARIDEARLQYNVLEHPFYQRWSAGELSAEELGFYAGEYRHAVVALARASERAAATVGAEYRAGLARHAAEERSHIALWDEFAAAACNGVSARDGVPEGDGGAAHAGGSAREPLGETEDCVRSWTAGESALEHLAVLYAIEASQPAIAQTKLDGLVERYGYSPEGPAVEYFQLHATLDVEHARQARELIAELLSEDEAEARAHPEGTRQADRMVERATAALRGNWELLDGVDRRFAPVA
jgi:pyrroloquinoline-quinone synthase